MPALVSQQLQSGHLPQRHMTHGRRMSSRTRGRRPPGGRAEGTGTAQRGPGGHSPPGPWPPAGSTTASVQAKAGVQIRQSSCRSRRPQAIGRQAVPLAFRGLRGAGRLPVPRLPQGVRSVLIPPESSGASPQRLWAGSWAGPGDLKADGEHLKYAECPMGPVAPTWPWLAVCVCGAEAPARPACCRHWTAARGRKPALPSRTQTGDGLPWEAASSCLPSPLPSQDGG